MIEVRRAAGRVDLAAALAALGERGLTRVLVEGGGAARGGIPQGRSGRPHDLLSGAGGDGRRTAGLRSRAFGVEKLGFTPRFEPGFRAAARRRRGGNLARAGAGPECSPASSPTSATSAPSRRGGAEGDIGSTIARTKHDMAPGSPIGASIACSGCCLTVVEKGRTGSPSRLGRDAAQDQSRRLASRASASISNCRCSSATSWAATSSPAMSTASARSLSMTPEGGSVRFVFEARPTRPLHRVQGLDRGGWHLAHRERGRRRSASASTSFRTPRR